MKSFNTEHCESDQIIKIKNLLKRFNNKENVISSYENILEDTRAAVSNIEEVVNDPQELKDLLLQLKQCDTSFLDTILGTKEQGGNNSHYRAYLALDEKNIIEIRIANHFGTKSGILDKSNNKSQYLYQVVLITTPPMPQTNNSITTTTNVGNVKVITKGYIGENTTINDIKELLAEIHDYLIAPATSFDVENNNDMNENRTMAKKQVIRLNESQLRRIVKESVNKVLKEYNNDLDDMSNDGEYPYYVAADVNSEYFKTFREAYNYALRLARREKDWNDDILLMDNEEWQTIIRFTEDGIDDIQNGTHEQYPW